MGSNPNLSDVGNPLTPLIVPRLKSAHILNKINQTNAQFYRNVNQKKSVSLDNYYYTQQLREKLKLIVKKQQLQYTTLSSQSKKSLQINDSKEKLSTGEFDETSEPFLANLKDMLITDNAPVATNAVSTNTTSTAATANNAKSLSRIILNHQHHHHHHHGKPPKSAAATSSVAKDTSNNNTTATPTRINSSSRNLSATNNVAYVGSSNNYNLNYMNRKSPHLRNVPMFISGKSYSIPDVKINQIKLKP